MAELMQGTHNNGSCFQPAGGGWRVMSLTEAQRRRERLGEDDES